MKIFNFYYINTIFTFSTYSMIKSIVRCINLQKSINDILTYLIFGTFSHHFSLNVFKDPQHFIVKTTALRYILPIMPTEIYPTHKKFVSVLVNLINGPDSKWFLRNTPGRLLQTFKTNAKKQSHPLKSRDSTQRWRTKTKYFKKAFSET